MKSTHLKSKGIGMMELVIYIGILSAFMVAIVSVLVQIVRTYDQVRAQRDVVSNGRLAMATILQSIASAQAIYAPTSSFGSDAGQLSIVTIVGASTTEAISYVDFWLDGGRIWMRKAGSATTSITSPSVRVNQLRFDQMAQGLGREAVAVTLQITDSVPARFTASTTLHTTTALRGIY